MYRSTGCPFTVTIMRQGVLSDRNDATGIAIDKKIVHKTGYRVEGHFFRALLKQWILAKFLER